MLLDILEHPDRYSEEQLEELLKDEEIKSLVHDSAMIKRAIIKQHPQKVEERFLESMGQLMIHLL